MTAPEELEPSDSPSATLEADLGTLTDDEYFEDVEQVKAEGIVGRDDDGNLYEVDDGVADERGQQ